MDNKQYINEIKMIAKSKKISLENLATGIGLTPAGFHRALKKETLKLRDFLKICETLGISPAEIFETEMDNQFVLVKEREALYGQSDRQILEKLYKKVTELEKLIKKRGL